MKAGGARRKGILYENEVIAAISKHCGISCKRNLDQARDGGGDIPFGRFLIECKRRARISVYDWWDQCVTACKGQKTPVLAIRGDNRESLVVMRLEDFLALVPKEEPCPDLSRSPSPQP